MWLLGKLILLALLILVMSCGSQKVSLSTRNRLNDQYLVNLEKLRELSASHEAGWPSDGECDGALWAGLARRAGAEWVDVAAAVQHDGRPTRLAGRDCEIPEGSKTTTSNDMMTGITLGLMAARDLDTLSRMWDYGETHTWIMGMPEWYISRVLLRPNGITLLARAIHKLGGSDYAIRFAPVVYGPVQEDFELHLIILSRINQTDVGGPQYGTELAEQLISVKHPDDALVQAVAGNYTEATNLLLSDYKSPSYVRGGDNYPLVHWLLAARIVLENN